MKYATEFVMKSKGIHGKPLIEDYESVPFTFADWITIVNHTEEIMLNEEVRMIIDGYLTRPEIEKNQSELINTVKKILTDQENKGGNKNNQ
jgi:hypothetical protein